MILDSHVHFGTSSWGDATPEELLEIINEVDFAICSNLEGIESINFKDELTCNLEMIQASRKIPKLKPLLVCQPNLTSNENIARKLLEEYNDFVGLKIHPECMKLPANSDKYNPYLDLAKEFKNSFLVVFLP